MKGSLASNWADKLRSRPAASEPTRSAHKVHLHAPLESARLFLAQARQESQAFLGANNLTQRCLRCYETWLTKGYLRLQHSVHQIERILLVCCVHHKTAFRGDDQDFRFPLPAIFNRAF